MEKASVYLDKLKKAIECETTTDVRYQIGKAKGFCKIFTEGGVDVPKSLLSRIESFKKRQVQLSGKAGVGSVKDITAKTKKLRLEASIAINTDFPIRLQSCDNYESMEVLFQDAKTLKCKITLLDNKRGVAVPEEVSELKLRLDVTNREIIDFILAGGKKLGYYVQSKTMPAKKFVTVSPFL